MNYFSIAGKHHNYADENNQDAVMFKKNTEYCAMVLADGVSACKKSRTGAEIACKAVSEFLLKHAERLFAINEYEIADGLISHILYCLKETADKENTDIEEYSSTVACILFDRKHNRILYFSIGDSLITATKNDKCYIVAMPSDSRNGCCVTTTFNAASVAKVGFFDADNIESIMLSSDGAWHLMYRQNTMEQAIKELILNQEYDKLKKKLMEKERYDDCSFITMNLKEYSRRKTA